ncbi:hypothetical protein OGAPHI_000672 [Ogataea philodendri]|uniref:Uncharacterized protein n=1 Tax=Ogataea philodendri TaxID=1378263 RepID=A0A9P8PFH4_9ASCO|nr:uncharacterized protein OGAPHI_000672 [Ogataea philodendri]KAH3670961.1 hypothetical protein OGAPHI_000672 [Ogataea philodendri]
MDTRTGKNVVHLGVARDEMIEHDMIWDVFVVDVLDVVCVSKLGKSGDTLITGAFFECLSDGFGPHLTTILVHELWEGESLSRLELRYGGSSGGSLKFKVWRKSKWFIFSNSASEKSYGERYGLAASDVSETFSAVDEALELFANGTSLYSSSIWLSLTFSEKNMDDALSSDSPEEWGNPPFCLFAESELDSSEDKIDSSADDKPTGSSTRSMNEYECTLWTLSPLRGVARSETPQPCPFQQLLLQRRVWLQFQCLARDGSQVEVRNVLKRRLLVLRQNHVLVEFVAAQVLDPSQVQCVVQSLHLANKFSILPWGHNKKFVVLRPDSVPFVQQGYNPDMVVCVQVRQKDDLELFEKTFGIFWTVQFLDGSQSVLSSVQYEGPEPGLCWNPHTRRDDVSQF